MNNRMKKPFLGIAYSNVPKKRAYTFISGKVCVRTFIRHMGVNEMVKVYLVRHLFPKDPENTFNAFT